MKTGATSEGKLVPTPMKITVAHRYYFEELIGSPAEAGLFKTHRIISINSVRQPEDPFARGREADTLL